MKKYMILGAILVSGVIFAQNEVKPKYEIVNGSVKATYFYEDGKIQQQGFYKDGKLDGKWITYDESGNKKSIGEYASGTKTGKWFFWNNDKLSEVDYSDSRVANVKTWSSDALVNRN